MEEPPEALIAEVPEEWREVAKHLWSHEGAREFAKIRCCIDEGRIQSVGEQVPFEFPRTLEEGQWWALAYWSVGGWKYSKQAPPWLDIPQSLELVWQPVTDEEALRRETAWLGEFLEQLRKEADRHPAEEFTTDHGKGWRSGPVRIRINEILHYLEVAEKLAEEGKSKRSIRAAFLAGLHFERHLTTKLRESASDALTRKGGRPRNRWRSVVRAMVRELHFNGSKLPKPTQVLEHFGGCIFDKKQIDVIKWTGEADMSHMPELLWIDFQSYARDANGELRKQNR